MELFSTWYRVISPDGGLWMETSAKSEALAAVRENKGFQLQRLQTFLTSTGWEPWDPADSETESYISAVSLPAEREI